MLGVYAHKTGNVSSIVSSLEKFTNEFRVFDDSSKFAEYSRLIIPGVGNMSELTKDKFLKENLSNYKKTQKKILGICLGAQYFMESSSEANVSTASLINGSTKSLKDDFGINLNVCFNRVEKNHEDQLNNQTINLLFKDIWTEKFYFLHKYYMHSEDQDCQVLYSVKSKKKIPSVVIKENIIGVQFHPELSFDAGIKFLKNFYTL